MLAPTNEQIRRTIALYRSTCPVGLIASRVELPEPVVESIIESYRVTQKFVSDEMELGIVQQINPIDKQILLFENHTLRNKYWDAFTDAGRQEREMKKCNVVVREE